MDEQQQKNSSDSFVKEQMAKGKDKLKDEAKKQVRKKVTAVASILAHLSTMLIPLICFVSVFITIILFAGWLKELFTNTSGDTVQAKQKAISLSLSQDTESDAISLQGGSSVKIDEPNALSAPTREQLETIINAMSDEQAKQNLLGVIDDLMYIQENNKVNAIFAIALIRKESSGGIRLGFNRSINI